jgi:pyruvate-formate lyase-activating enzyme
MSGQPIHADVTDLDDRELRCTWCRNPEPLHVELAWTNQLPRVAGFWCGAESCGAEWEADGTVRTSGRARRQR